MNNHVLTSRSGNPVSVRPPRRHFITGTQKYNYRLPASVPPAPPAPAGPADRERDNTTQRFSVTTSDGRQGMAVLYEITVIRSRSAVSPSGSPGSESPWGLSRICPCSSHCVWTQTQKLQKKRGSGSGSGQTEWEHQGCQYNSKCVWWSW